MKVNVLYCVLIIAAFLYLLLIAAHYGSLVYTTKFAYYNNLVDAFMHGRLDVDMPPGTLDLSVFHHKVYLYWGPAPVLFIFPFYLLMGKGASDTFYTVVNCLLNIYLFYLLVLEFYTYFKREKNWSEIAVLLISFALASPNFFFAVKGSIWMTNQSVAVLYLLVSYLFFFKFLNVPKRTVFLFVAVVFFHLAWLSRLSLVVHGLLFLYPLGIIYQKHKNQLRYVLAVIAGISIFFVGLFCMYNYLRFGSPLETGHKYHRPNVRFQALMHETISPKYIPKNSFYYLFNHVRIDFTHPYGIHTDPEGNSIFSVYPLSLFFLFIFQKKFLSKKFVLLSLGVILAEMAFFLMFFNTGWIQFGSRYFFDLTPLVFLLTALALPDIPPFIQYSVVAYGILINTLGMLIY